MKRNSTNSYNYGNHGVDSSLSPSLPHHGRRSPSHPRSYNRVHREQASAASVTRSNPGHDSDPRSVSASPGNGDALGLSDALGFNGAYVADWFLEGSVGSYSSPSTNRPLFPYNGILQSDTTSVQTSHEFLRAILQEALDLVSEDTDQIIQDHEEAGSNMHSQ
jgi:hypothetical protein